MKDSHSSPKTRFLGQLSDIRADASLYSHEQAASLYVNHPEGLPGLERNSLIVGPIGSGKTIMLKSLYSDWLNSANLAPVYVDVLTWTSSIAGETETYTSERLSPRGRTMLEAMSLALGLGICESAGVFNGTQSFPRVWSSFEPALGTSDPVKVLASARQIILEALVAGKSLPPYLPSVFAVATALGSDIRNHENKTLVLLMDQIDQVSSLFFSPIASLLRRSSEYISVLATRPCPTAPEPEMVPDDITSGDSYRTIQLGRSLDGDIPHTFVLRFIQALPLIQPFKGEIEDRAELIANLMWPSLRFAVSSIREFVRLRSSGRHADESWYQAIREIAQTYEDIVQDGLRAWCRNPRAMLSDWRRLVIKERGGKPAAIGRANLRFPKNDLFGDVKGRSAQNLIRVALKKGILLMGPSKHYVPGVIPSLCEIAPLLLVSDPDVDLTRFDSNVATVNIPQDMLDRWSRTFAVPIKKSAKRIFVSYWMSDPEKTGESPLLEIVRSKFGNSVDITTGALVGSPRWSAEIIEKISKVDLVLCDLTVPRRDVFVEYGVAIGTHIPVIQCVSGSVKDVDSPTWVLNRQNQYFSGSPSDNDRFDTSISALLEDVRNPRSFWKRDSAGRSLDSLPDIKSINLIGPKSSNRIFAEFNSAVSESGFNMRFHEVSKKVDSLEECIKFARQAGTFILAFDATSNDYLTCAAGGIFATKHKGQIGNRSRYDRDFFLIDVSGGDTDQLFPGLLRSHPRAVICDNQPELGRRLRARISYLRAVLSKARRSRK